MTYSLLPITPADKEKILRDAASNPKKLTWIDAAMRSREFCDTWAFDIERDNYLFMVPGATREEWDRQPYCAFVDGHMYRLAANGFFPSGIYIEEDASPPPATISTVQNELRAAFSIYGWMGQGPDDEWGDPALFGPKFMEKPPLDAM